jgi:uncharacterized protein (DUF927 family)
MDLQPDAFAPLPPAGATSATEAQSAAADTWRPILPAPLPLLRVIRHPRFGQPSMVWHYQDAAGALLHVVCRFDFAGKRKQFAPLACGPDGWRWRGVPALRPLFGLDTLAERPGDPVIICEGEKSAIAAGARLPGFVPMTWSGGAEQPHLADWSPLAGRRCILWRDHDRAGARAMGTVAAKLQAAGAASVALVTIPADWPEKWDLADALPEGASLETLAAMIAAAEPVAAAGEDAAPGLADAEAIRALVSRAADMDGATYAARRAAMAEEAPGLGVVTLDKLRREARKRRAGEQREAFDGLGDAEAMQEGGEASPAGGAKVRWPPGYSMRRAGLFVAREDGSDRIAGPFAILGRARDEAGEGWGLALQWRDDDGRDHRAVVPSRLIHSEPGALETTLAEAGLFISPEPGDRLALRDALAGLKTSARVRRATRCGWQPGGAVYLLPDGATIGEAGEPVLLDHVTAEDAARCGVSGDLEGWQSEVAALAIGNPAAAFCLAAAFAGPILDIAGEPSGGFHLAGPSKIGKTLALMMGVSGWGRPYKAGALRDWRSTANAMEAALEQSSDGLLGLDEIGQAEPREVEAALYQAANEGGKARLRSDATARARRVWRTLLLSTGEVSPAAKAAEAGRTLRPGAEVRLPAIRFASDAAAMWPQLHGKPDRAALWASLHAGMQRHHGAAIRVFLGRLAAARREDEAGLREAIAAHRRAFLAEHLPSDAADQARTVAARCALVAAAGEIATDMAVLPWPAGEATRAAAAALAAWLAEREGSGAGEDAAALRMVRGFIERHAEGRFGLIDRDSDGKPYSPDAGRPILNRAGWRMRPTNEGQPWRYLILPEVWRAEVLAGLDPTAAARALHAAGFLAAGDGRNLSRKVMIPSEGRQIRVYVVSGGILE